MDLVLFLYHLFILSCRLQLPNVLRCVCACLNCYDRNTSTDVLSATNARAKHIDDPEHIYNDDPKRGDKHKGIPVIILKTKMKSQECVTVETPCTVPDVAGSEDLAVHPFAKMNTLQCTNIKSPHRMLRATRSMPHGTRNKQLVTQPFGVHPYAVVDLQKVRNLLQASCNFPWLRLFMASIIHYSRSVCICI